MNNLDRVNKALWEDVKRVLWEDWDPIGVRQMGGPDDEYDSYVPTVVRMLKAGTSEEELVAHLHSIATDRMGLDAARPHHAARALLKLETR